MTLNVFDILILIARPAAGKSEIIDFLKHVPFEERARRFHIGGFREIDDFPMLGVSNFKDIRNLSGEPGKPETGV